MVTAELKKYLEEGLHTGVSKDVLYAQLVSAGWNPVDINEGFQSLSNIGQPVIQNPVGMVNTTQQPVQNPAPEYAGFWIRVAAIAVDGMIFNLIVVVTIIALVLLVPSSVENKLISGAIVVLLYIGYFLYFVIMQSGPHQATIGKRLAGIKVVSAVDGSRISFSRSLGRELSKIISYIVFMIGFIMAGFTEKKQGLHDMIAGTVVVKEKPARVGAMLLIIFGPLVLEVIAFVVFFAMIFSVILGSAGNAMNKIQATDNLGSFVDNTNNTINKDNNLSDTENTNMDYNSAGDPTIEPMTTADYDKELATNTMNDFDVENPGAYVGPAIVEFHSLSDSVNVYDQVEVFLPDLTNIEKARIYVSLSHVYSKKGVESFAANNAFETNEFFNEVDISKHTNSDGDVYYNGHRGIHYVKGKELTLKTFGYAQGVMKIELPISGGKTYTKEYQFTIKNK